MSKGFWTPQNQICFFLQKVILVEGLAEQLLLSILAKYVGKSIEDNHVAVINVGGRFFDHFIHLFNSKNDLAIQKKIACLSDRDPERKPKSGGKFSKCYPFEYKQDTDKYEYKNNSSEKISQYEKDPNVQFFSQEEANGKTFEYNLIFNNPSLEILITDSLSNQDELKGLMRSFMENKPVEEMLGLLRETDENQNIKNGILECKWSDEKDKRAAIIAARYLNSVSKGQNALELAYVLESNLNKKGGKDYKEILVPTYIKDALAWLCQ